MADIPISPMPGNSLQGYVTRPQAAKRYNRSQRALERDITLALAIQDEDVLSHWKLATKDKHVFDAFSVTTKQVDELVEEGMVPTWHVEELWLETQYGRKGESPKPMESDTSDSTAPRAQEPIETESAQPAGKARRTTSRDELHSLPDDVEFLKERIRTLEQEKREEADRNEKREAKLFEQLAVKDTQISAWDGVTQSLTKALATGQLKPDFGTMLLTSPNPAEKSDIRDPNVQDAEVAHSDARKSSKPAKQSTTAHSRKTPPRQTKNPAVPKHKRPKAKKKTVTKPPPKPRWYDTPTISRFLSRK